MPEAIKYRVIANQVIRVDKYWYGYVGRSAKRKAWYWSFWYKDMEDWFDTEVALQAIEAIEDSIEEKTEAHPAS